MNRGLIERFEQIVGRRNVLSKMDVTASYRSGFRAGRGDALAVVFPANPVEQWQVIEASVRANCIIIMQAAKTGLTGGSAPDGYEYDREVVIINTTRINKIVMLEGGRQVLAFAGTTLFELEQELKKIGRAPHSILGSSAIGATVIGGIANNSGGALVKRGPAYTELALYAQVDKDGRLHLVNHLGINNLGETPEEILTNIFDEEIPAADIVGWEKMASDSEYSERLRDIDSDTPARFNADERRLFETSGCAGKLGVFAVRVDTWPLPEEEQIFYIGTNTPDKLEQLRCDILRDFTNLPDMAEYMHKDAFDIAENYGKDVFLSIKYIGTKRLSRVYALKARIENALNRISFLPKYIPDRFFYYLSQFFPQYLPEWMLEFRKRFEHVLILKMSDAGIEETRQYFAEKWKDDPDFDFFECDANEAEVVLQHHFATASAVMRYQRINSDRFEDVLALDIALRRNDFDWMEKLSPEITSNLDVALYYGHFICHVFHQDYIFKKGTDLKKMEKIILEKLNAKGARYPAEHNVGHLYQAEEKLEAFYNELDPTNTFNSGIGKTSKHRRNCSCNCCR